MRRFLRGFIYAGKGVAACILGERNMRVHLCAAFYVLALMPFYHFTRTERLAVFIVIGMVISAEAFNTAIEAIVDLVSPEQNRLAGLAKDAGAGAVLITAAAAAAVGVTLYADIGVLAEIFHTLTGSIPLLTGALASLVLWIIIICSPLHHRGQSNGDEK